MKAEARLSAGQIARTVNLSNVTYYIGRETSSREDIPACGYGGSGVCFPAAQCRAHGGVLRRTVRTVVEFGTEIEI